ncbi:MAG: 2'-5' RNA ligase family protein [Bacteroidetes bacterium]|nr:2'-5' RNA ligase family protein [Bacteroidota bacterium]
MKTGLVKQSNYVPISSVVGGMNSAIGGMNMAHQGGRNVAAGSGMSLAGDMGQRAEYLLVIYPHGELEERLLHEQRQLASEFGLPAGGRNRPHITVAAFQAGELMEDTLIRWIQRICNRHRSFDITLNNYSGFPPHTIYLRVQDHQPFFELMHQLRAIDEFIRSCGCPPVNLVSNPYLSIAGGLTERVYNRAMPEYSRKDFHESFLVDRLVLLKRGHSFDACKTVNIFRLLPETI